VSNLEILRKRFIAGAVCPQCSELDRIVVEFARDSSSEEELNRRRCVACGFVDEFSSVDGAPARGVPKGRPERPASEDVDSVKVRILDPKDSL